MAGPRAVRGPAQVLAGLRFVCGIAEVQAGPREVWGPPSGRTDGPGGPPSEAPGREYHSDTLDGAQKRQYLSGPPDDAKKSHYLSGPPSEAQKSQIPVPAGPSFKPSPDTRHPN